MTLAATVFAATGGASIGTKFSICMYNIINNLVTTHGWTVINCSFYNTGTSLMELAATNEWDDPLQIRLRTGQAGDRCWIVLQNAEGKYVIFSVTTWVDASTCNFQLGMSYTLPTGGGTTAPPSSIDIAWCSNGVNNDANTYDFRLVLWADTNSFFFTTVRSGGVTAGCCQYFLKMAKVAVEDLCPYIVGGGGAYAYQMSTSSTNSFLAAQIWRTTPMSVYKLSAGDACNAISSNFALPCLIGNTSYYANDNRAVISNVAGEKLEWEIQVFTGTTASSSLTRRGAISDIRLKWTPGVSNNTDGEMSTDGTRISIGELSLPWDSGTMTWPPAA
jgi:hypothetical protein